MSSKERKRKIVLEELQKGLINLKEASERMSVSYRQAKRIKRRYNLNGDNGLVHGNRGKKSNCRHNHEFKNKVLKIYQEKYLDFGPTFAAEKLEEEDGLIINPETLRLWLMQAHLWCKHRRRKSYRQRRERKQCFGELLQIDGSIHSWFGKEDVKDCLLNIVDDATGRTLSRMDTGETTYVLLSSFKAWIKKYGVPKAVYVDLKNLYVSHKRLTDNESDITTTTAFERVCNLLNVKIIKAYSPQAKGRVERNHGVYQDRFVKELKLKNITTIDKANEFLQNHYIDKINAKFAKKPASSEDAHTPAEIYGDLDQIFCWESERRVFNDFTVRFNNEIFQLDRIAGNRLRPYQLVRVRVYLDKSVGIWFHERQLNYRKVAEISSKQKTVIKPMRMGISSEQRSAAAKASKHKTPWSNFNPAWLNGKRKSTVTQTNR